MVARTTAAEPWEYAVQAVFRVLCQHGAATDLRSAIATMTATTRELVQVQDPATAVTRTRIGLTALDLAAGTEVIQTRALTAALFTTASADAYAARDLLASSQTAHSLTSARRSGLYALVRASGLGAGMIPSNLHDQLTSAVIQAEAASQRERPRAPVDSRLDLSNSTLAAATGSASSASSTRPSSLNL